MHRVLRSGPRPYIVSAIVFTPLLVALFIMAMRSGGWRYPGQIALAWAAFCIFVSGNRIVVTDDYLEYCVAFMPRGRVYFRDIVASVPMTLAERDWPVRLQIYVQDDPRPQMSLLLKPWHKTDVDWLLSLPQLKVRSTLEV